MTSSAEIPWKRISVEGAAIVASILLAFAIDAWWQDRADAERERRVMVALLAEFERNDSLLQDANGLYKELYSQSVRILDNLETGMSGLSDAELEKLMAGLLRGTTVHLESGAHDALLSSGELSLIRDVTLRNRLAAWPSHVAEWSEEKDAVFRYVRENLQPYFSDLIPVRGLGQQFAPFPEGESPPPVLPAEFDAGAMRAIAETVSFENLIYQKAQGLWYAMRDGETLRARLRDIQALLSEQLDNNQ